MLVVLLLHVILKWIFLLPYDITVFTNETQGAAHLKFTIPVLSELCLGFEFIMTNFTLILVGQTDLVLVCDAY